MIFDSFLRAANFDSQLLELGLWESSDKKLLEEWAGTGDSRLKKTLAASLIAHLVLRLLGSDCNVKGKIRAKRIGATLSQFEQLLASTRGLENKFYRDHLDHVLRVALFARAIGRKAPFSLSNDDLDRLVLACLFHDVAYPLSESTRIFDSTLTAMKRCYLSAEGFSSYPLPKLIPNIDILSSLAGIKKELVQTQFKKLDHGLLGAAEFLAYLTRKEECYQRYSEVLRAIAFHSSAFTNEIDSSKDVLSAILILSDECQDWGRPTINESEAAISRIENFCLKDNFLEGCFQARPESSFSALKQVCGKFKNLRRLRLLPTFHFRWTFPLNNFRLVDLSASERLLQSLFVKTRNLKKDFCDFIESSYLHEEESIFETIYYGISVPRRTKEKIFCLLDEEELLNHSSFSSLYSFMNTALEEFVLLRKPIKELSCVEFSLSEDGSIILLLNDDQEKMPVKILAMSENETRELACELASEMRFLNICFLYLTVDHKTEVSEEAFRESFPSEETLRLWSSRIEELRNWRDYKLFQNIRDCILHEGIFLFE